MRVALQFLYHFCCDRCRRWWRGDRLYCPYCGYHNCVERIDTFRDAARGSCLIRPPDAPSAELPCEETEARPQEPGSPS
ncbi:hypothetical protein [Synechococcus sp. 63AY4M1]|uniref:hypothetical protein n=1 Tax=Synechococcus sp. 63AY4M1 TaxID=1353263 RepID=UPI000C17E04B|nr:hypothetical protein [Synechococcus sp. 63AY4M1]PIK97101.1 hypothetical protein SYN63AY4M1_02640 [Synechococcus sp. 63AY4M1]